MSDSVYAKRLQKLEPKPVDTGAITPEEERLLLNGEEVVVQPHNDHARHIQHHKNLKKVLFNRYVRKMDGQKVLHNLESHIQEHEMILRG